jgi:hypothetical protein
MRPVLKKIVSASLLMVCGLAIQSCNAGDEKEGLPSEVIAHRYSGSLIELEPSLKRQGYSETGAFFVKNGEHSWETDTDMMGVEWCLLDNKLLKRCFFVIRTVVERDSKGFPKVKLEDALEFLPISGFQFLAEGDECLSKLHPNRSVVAIGRWQNRSKPKIGGYAYSIRQAWIVEPLTKKFVEVSPKEVSCEINEDRD